MNISICAHSPNKFLCLRITVGAFISAIGVFLIVMNASALYQGIGCGSLAIGSVIILSFLSHTCWRNNKKIEEPKSSISISPQDSGGEPIATSIHSEGLIEQPSGIPPTPLSQVSLETPLDPKLHFSEPLPMPDPITLRSLDLETLQLTSEEIRRKGEEALAKRRADFETAALSRMKGETLSSFEFPDENNPQFLQAAQEACKWHLKQGIKEFGGATHQCIVTDKIPGILFKSESRAYGHDRAQWYVKRAHIVSSLCTRSDFLYVPKCKSVTHNNVQFVMEEFCALSAYDYDSSYALFQWLFKNPDLQSYARAQLIELAILIYKSRWVDVKYDNIIISKDARICLFDLFDPPSFRPRSNIAGLIGGLCYRESGFFTMLPSSWIMPLFKAIESHLTQEDAASLKEMLPQFEEGARLREKEMDMIAEFHKKAHVTFPEQPLIFQESDFEGNLVACK